MRSPSRRRAGRALLEMIVVLALLGILAAAVAPALRTAFDERGAALVAHALAARLEQARATAARNAVVVTVVLDPVRGRTWTATGDGAPFVADDPLPLHASGEAPVTIDAAGPRAQWTFLASGGAFAEPVLVRDRSTTIAVDVDPVTGAAHASPR